MRTAKHLAAAAILLAAAMSSPGCLPKEPAKAPARSATAKNSPPPPVFAAEAPPSVEPPVKLVAPDGTALSLVSFTGRAVLHDPLAFTELKLVFENPEDRIIEGTFSVRLPAGASPSRLAMKIGDAFQEGEIVERAAARTIYEDFLHRRQDPALLEKAQGNELSARVFPIPARGRKEIILSYSQELSKSEPYTLPLRGLPRVDELDLAVFVDGASAPAETLVKQGFQPAADFTLASEKIPRSVGLRDKNSVVVRVTPVADSQPEPLPPTLILVDTSASRALGFEDEARLVADLARRVASSAGPSAPLSVAAYDQTTEPIFDGEAGAFGDRHVAFLIERGALGASNIEAALSFAAIRAKLRGLSRVILVTDGIATAGALAPPTLRAAVSALSISGVERLDVIAVGGIRDDDGLRLLASAGLPRAGVVVDASEGLDRITKRLNEATRVSTSISIEGARFSWPQRAFGLQAGDEVRVFADVPEDAPIKVSIDGAPGALVALAPPGEPRLFRRAFAGAKIASLLDAEARLGGTAETQRKVVALSIESRILSPYTSLLVLETDADYQRYHIDRRALGDLLTIDDGKLAVAPRLAPPPEADANETDEQNAAPGAESEPDAPLPPGPLPSWRREEPDEPGPTSRSPAAGPSSGRATGSVHGRIPAEHRAASSPSIRMGGTTVSGRLPPEIIRHIVHLNFGRFRSCYESGLRTRPALAGRVVVRFVIDETGAPQSAVSDGSDLPDPNVVRCVVDVFSSLSFPAVDTGPINVIYPMMFSPISKEKPDERAPEVEPPLPAPRVREAYIPPPPPPEERGERAFIEPYAGPFKQVMDALAKPQHAGGDAALATALAWRKKDPGDALALVALGEALEAKGDAEKAARAYGSLIDLFPARADMRRFAGERLERIRGAAALDLAIDTFRRAAKDRPDHPSSHRLLAMALLKRGAFEEAFHVMAAALRRSYPVVRFGGVALIMKEDLGLIAAAWIRAEPDLRGAILDRLRDAGARLEEEPSLRFVLVWETDANDVDFHIKDSTGGHAFFGNHRLPTGGELYADITTGYGPECFAVRTSKKSRPDGYMMEANYYARGPMGYGMGKLQIIDHDGSGGLHFEERPFVAMNDRASVYLGWYPGWRATDPAATAALGSP